MVTKGPDMRRYIMQNYPSLNKVSCRRVDYGWFIDIKSSIVHATNEERQSFRKKIYNTCSEKLNPYDNIRYLHVDCPDTLQEIKENADFELRQIEKKKKEEQEKKERKRKLDDDSTHIRKKIQKKDIPSRKFEDSLQNISEEYQMVQLWKKELTKHMNMVLAHPFKNKDVYLAEAKNNIENVTSLGRFYEVRSGDYSKFMPKLISDVYSQGIRNVKDCLLMHDHVIRDPETAEAENVIKFEKLFTLEENEEEELECTGSRTVEERNEKGFETAIVIE